MLFPEVAGGRRDYGSFPDYNFAILLQGLANVVFAYEVRRLPNGFQTLGC